MRQTNYGFFLCNLNNISSIKRTYYKLIIISKLYLPKLFCYLLQQSCEENIFIRLTLVLAVPFEIVIVCFV